VSTALKIKTVIFWDVMLCAVLSGSKASTVRRNLMPAHSKQKKVSLRLEAVGSTKTLVHTRLRYHITDKHNVTAVLQL
jgi:hypothetical protein